MQTLDEAARQEIYAQIQQRIMDQAMILPIRDYVNLNATHSYVQGLRFDRQGWFPWLYEVSVTRSK